MSEISRSQKLFEILMRVARKIKHWAGFSFTEPLLKTRNDILCEYIGGSGLELGALHNPMKVPGNVKVCYVDRMSVAELRKHYPELEGKKLANVDIVTDGERLTPIPNESQDFVLANHFLEHCQNPILAIENMLRVLKVSGILLLSIPDKRFSFDRTRTTTPFEHLLNDYAKGPDDSKERHFVEHITKNGSVPQEYLEEKVRCLMAMDYSIHFHVWSQREIVELVLRLYDMFGFEIELIRHNISEIIVVLRKSARKKQTETS